MELIWIMSRAACSGNTACWNGCWCWRGTNWSLKRRCSPAQGTNCIWQLWHKVVTSSKARARSLSIPSILLYCTTSDWLSSCWRITTINQDHNISRAESDELLKKKDLKVKRRRRKKAITAPIISYIFEVVPPVPIRKNEGNLEKWPSPV